ncbi:hypothetical protein CASFOL_009583 [Castilleja foliolosa]|uniref:Uncharacterized protein n=1 Tax=Castilleja foliolosa TaxID=1961234 RepID=A0ABD3E0L2_9LAMI
MNNLRSISAKKHLDVLKLTEQFSSLKIQQLGWLPSSSSSASSSSSSSSSTNSCMDSPVYSVSKGILDRFSKKESQYSDLTRHVIERTRPEFMNIPTSIYDIATTMSSDFFLRLRFRFLPGQDSFITQNLCLPKTLENLIHFKNKLGLSQLSNVGLSPLSNVGLSSLSGLSPLSGLSSLAGKSPLPFSPLSNHSLKKKIAEKASAIYSRIWIEAITYHNGYYGRFLILVQLGLKCTVWYGFHPGDALSIPTDALLFHPIDSYDRFLYQPEIHVQPGFEKLTLIENDENILPKLAEAFTREKPLIDIKIPNASGSVCMSVGLGLAIVILLSLGINPSADLNEITA